VGQDGEAGIADRKDIEYLGTLKAVTAFLEQQVGVRFLMPGKHGVYVPKHDMLSVDADMSVFWEPKMAFVTGRAPKDRVVAVAGNYFGRTPVVYSYGGHSYYSAVPAKTYGASHPEYFALVGAQRTSKGNHLCIANPEVRELMLKEMENQLDKGYQWVELAQTDGYQPCECAACKAIHPDPGERTWIFHRQLAEAMKQRRPGKKVMIISYPPTREPPKSFTRFPDNVVIQMCSYSPDAFADWAPFGVDKVVYAYNWGHYQAAGFAAKRTPRYVVEQIRLFLKNQVRGVYLCGGFEGQGSFGLEGPSYYAFGKALENPERDWRELEREYVDAAFGEAAAPMRSFFRAMHERLDAFSVFNHPNTGEPKVASPFGKPEDYYCGLLPARLVDDMSRNLERAKAAAVEERVKAHLRLVEAEFSMVKNLAAVFQVYQAYRASPNATLLAALGAVVGERQRLLQSLFPGGNPMPIEGLPSPFGGAARDLVADGGKNSALLGAPLNWDFALLLKRGLLPGTQQRSVRARRADRIVLDGKLSDPAWAKAEFQELSEIGMGTLKNAARFKVLYDTEAFYVGVECETDKAEALAKLEPTGRDGNAWARECVELMIDPFGEREKHCQLAFNPVPDSAFDARLGYIQDPYHPLFGKRDTSWNGGWTYAAVIDKEKGRWTAEVRIPFATLEVEPPGRGTRWTMNVGRAEYPRGAEKEVPVLSLWSPNLETRSFHDRNTFGDVIFE
ncbi:MAG TPA: DUF4838 domain-containing protein, partial [Candidatus Brocadiia bacterium]|nr:DUF4838 domain-containing protein [Candidatus Brocadiia bacterium]